MFFSDSQKKKHMPQRQGLPQTNTNFAAPYRPARLFKRKSGWIIAYYFYNRYTNELELKRIRVDKIREQFGKNCLPVLYKMVDDINRALRSGWTPLVTPTPEREYHCLLSLIDKFIIIKNKELRPDSMRHYRSSMVTFSRYIKHRRLNNITAPQFGKREALDYCDYLLLHRNCSARTFNNLKNMCKTLFNWLLEREYTDNNPFIGIRSKPTEVKKRKMLPPHELQRVLEYLRTKNKGFFVFCIMEYSCLMRPLELFRLRIENVDLQSGYIHLSGEQTKNKKPRDVVIPDFAAGIITEWYCENKYNKLPSRYFLFSNRFSFTAGKVQNDSRTSTRAWQRLRKELNLPEEYQLYSLRDTGITDMLYSNITPKAVQMHADHHSLEMTEIYSHTLTRQGENELRAFTPPKIK